MLKFLFHAVAVVLAMLATGSDGKRAGKNTFTPEEPPDRMKKAMSGFLRGPYVPRISFPAPQRSHALCGQMLGWGQCAAQYASILWNRWTSLFTSSRQSMHRLRQDGGWAPMASARSLR